jgi:hypothetical protein
MDLAAIVTIAGVGVIVAALAVYLITISYLLVKISYTLGTVLIGVRAIANRCEPLRPILGGILENVSTIQRELSDIAPEDVQEAQENGSPRRRRARR